MSPYRLFPRPPTVPDAFANPPKHPRITIYPATTQPSRKRGVDLSVALVWGCVVAFAILFVEAILHP